MPLPLQTRPFNFRSSTDAGCRSRPASDPDSASYISYSAHAVLVSLIRRMKLTVRQLAQVIFNLRHISRRKAPIVISQIVKIREAVAFNSSGQIHVRIEITPSQISQ